MKPNRQTTTMGERIAQARREGGMTQRDLARAMEVSKSLISFWETGERDVRTNLLPRLAGVLRLTVAELLGIEDDTVAEIKRLRETLNALEEDARPCAEPDCVRLARHSDFHWNGNGRHW
jgi:transcriptional regulator with XRE-family HTH domain